MEDINNWGLDEKAPEQVTLKEMDAIVQTYTQARLAYEEAKKRSNDLYAELTHYEGIMINALTSNGKTNYSVDGVGTISVVTTESYKTPKDIESKTKLFNYVKQKYGSEALLNMTNIHSATLNAWANQEAASGVMSIPGLDQPTVTESIRFRRK